MSNMAVFGSPLQRCRSLESIFFGSKEFLPRRDYNLERQQLNGIGHKISTSQDVRKVANGCMVELLKVLTISSSGVFPRMKVGSCE